MDDTVDGERHHPDSERENDTSEANHQSRKEHEESSHDADGNFSFDEVSNDSPEDELAPWVDIVRSTHKVDDLSASDGITSWILGQSQIYWKQARINARDHERRWTKLICNWSPAISTTQKSYHKQGGLAKIWEDDINTYLQHARNNRDNSDLTNGTTWFSTAQDGVEKDSMESDSKRHRQPTRPMTSITTNMTTQSAHIQRILKTNFRITKATNSTHTLPQTRPIYSTDARPLSFKRQKGALVFPPTKCGGGHETSFIVLKIGYAHCLFSPLK